MISAIVLAAGCARRMGTQKLLLPYADGSLISHVVDQLLASPVEQVLVVTGADHTAIRAALGDRAVRYVNLASPSGEMLLSVRCGLKAISDETRAVLVVLGDVPGISADLVTRMIQAFRTSDCGIVVPVFRGKRGHPLLVARRYRTEILTGFEGRGLRGLLAAHPDDVHGLGVSSTSVLEDIDCPEDYQRAIGGSRPR